MEHDVLQAAKAEGKATLAITNGRVVNVCTGEIYEGGVACLGETILAQGDVDYAIGAQTEVIDAGGRPIVPGFLEGHIHPESSNLSPRRFAQAVLPHGTTSTFSDFHEVAIVRGIEGVNAALDEAADTYLNFFWIVPSHVPFSGEFETSGGYFNSTIVGEAMKRPEAWGLSEVVSKFVLEQNEDLLQSIDHVRVHRKAQVGHGPATLGKDWNAFAGVGIANDHEAIDETDLLTRARNGVYTHLRHSLICPTLPALLAAVRKHGLDTRLFSLVTDDTNAIVLTEEGHIDYLVRIAMAEGIDFMTAIQMGTWNTAVSYHAEQKVGCLAPGRLADILVLSDDSPQFEVDVTVAQGRKVAEGGKYLLPVDDSTHDPIMFNTFNLKAPVTGTDLILPAPEGAASAQVHVMKMLPDTPYVTTGLETTLPVREGFLACDPAQDIFHLAVVERHQATGNIGKAFVSGFGMREGSLACSMAHDNHNVVVTGSNAADMAKAVAKVVEMDGGVCLVSQGSVVEAIATPLFGLLSDEDPWVFAARKKKLIAACVDLGCTVSEPHLFLAFLTLVPIPAFKLTDKGYVDSIQWAFKEPVLAWTQAPSRNPTCHPNAPDRIS